MYLCKCCVVATSRRGIVIYHTGRQYVAHVVQMCAGLAAAPPRIHETQPERLALCGASLLAGSSAGVRRGDGLASARAGGLPPPRAAAALDPVPDRPRRPAPRPSPRAPDARDRPEHRLPAPTPRSGGNEFQVGSAV